MANQYSDPLDEFELQKVNRGLCRERFCRKKRRKHKTRCYKHLHDHFKKTNPIAYCYQVLKGNAKRRKVDFSLTLEQFKGFIKETDYLNLKGKSKLSLCIDRKDNNEGYHIWNIRAITLQANSWKRNYVDYGNKDEIECPF